MASSPWSKGLFTKKIKPPNSRESAMPTAANPIALNLSGNELVFEDGVWKQGKQIICASDGKDASTFGEVTREAFEELRTAQQLNEELRERNNMLELKLQLLINMLAVSNSDLETMQELEKKYMKKIRKLQKQLGKNGSTSPRLRDRSGSQ